MAISISEQYPGKTAGNTTDYPFGEARNVTAPGDGTGTPWEQAIVNDDQGFKQALLAAAGVAPSGTPDTALASQYLQALQTLFTGKISATLSANGSASIPVMVGTTPRVLIFKWGTFNTNGSNVIPNPQLVPIEGVPNAVFYVGLSEDGGASGGLETAQMDWVRTTKTNLAVYSNYTGTCKYFLVGW